MLTLHRCVIYWKPIICTLVLCLITCLTNKFISLPISGIYLIIYIATVWTITTWVSFVALQNFLQQNKNLSVNKFLQSSSSDKQQDLANIKKLTSDIDEYFIKKWFIYISNNEEFNDESRVILQEVLQKIITVQLSIDSQAFVQGILNVYLKHLKEYRRGLRRKDKYGGKISDLYRYSHICSNSTKSQDYFIHQLTTNLLNHFINWELNNSLPYRVLVSLVSQKVVKYLVQLLASPDFINFYILNTMASPCVKAKLDLNSFNRIKLLCAGAESDSPQVTTATMNEGDDDLQIEIKNAESPSSNKNVEHSEVDSSPVARINKLEELQVNKKDSIKFDEVIISEDVKIYEPKSVKTWYDSYDLDSVTLGQDMLSMFDDDDKSQFDDSIHDETSPMTAKSLFDEVKHITSEGIRTSMRPISDVTANTLHNIKDFQESTVNNVMKPVSQHASTAFHKIGGLNLQDEAAGVVEGILDFGRTKIRKGLRLTGLQDNIIEESARPAVVRKNITKLPHVKSQDKGDEAVETTWVNPLQEELAKIELKPDEEDNQVQKVPSITTQSHDEGSPVPEYEETADLATSIAKLRSLLEQKSSESNMSTPALSPMPPDEFSNKALSESEDIDEGDGMVPSFYKFCAKTATGVINNTLNTIKTALPGNITELGRFSYAEKWLFVESDTDHLFEQMNKLLSERKVFCTVDTAYEAIDSLAPLQGNENRSSDLKFEDELDDFEVKLPVIKALLDILCELLADVKDTSFAQEPVIKSILILLGNSLEENILKQANSFMHYYCTNATIPKEVKTNTLTMELDNFVDAVLSGVPDYFKYCIGEKAMKQSCSLFFSSLQVQKINQDMVMQIFEILCMKLMDGSKLLSPVTA